MSNPTEKPDLRKVIDTLHGSKWARIIPLILMGVIYVASMIAWHPAEPMAWVLPLLLDAFLAGGMYFINRFTPDNRHFSDIAVLFFSLFAAAVTLMGLRGLPATLQQGYNPGHGAGPAMFLGISLYHRRRMNKGL
jgi:peptidoglycan/LPS O-acetylase OafA/YrhL